MTYPGSKELILGPQSRALTPHGWLNLFQPQKHVRVELTDERWQHVLEVIHEAEEIAYRSDMELHGVSEKWSLPSWVPKILSPGFILAGDCEDVAMWIRKTLVKRCWPRGSLRLCYCRNPEDHIVLIAQTDQGDFSLQKGRAVPVEEETARLVSVESWPWWRVVLA